MRLNRSCSLLPDQKINLAVYNSSFNTLLLQREGKDLLKHALWFLGDVFEAEEIHREVLIPCFGDPKVVEVTPTADLLLNQALPGFAVSFMEVLLVDREILGLTCPEVKHRRHNIQRVSHAQDNFVRLEGNFFA